MAEGILSLGTKGNLMGQVVWSAAGNGADANSSAVTAVIQAKKTSDAGISTLGTFSASLTVGGVSQSFSLHCEVSNAQWKTVGTLSATVNHSTDGSGSCYLYGRINGPSGTTMEGISVSGSKTVVLDTIPRYAAIVTAEAFNDEENPTVTYTNPAGSAVTALQACISLDGETAAIAYRNISKTGTSYTFALTEAERDVLRNATPKNSRQVRFLIRSVIGGEQRLSVQEKTFTIVNANPTVNPTIADTNTQTLALTGDSGKLIRYFSNAQIAIGAQGKKGASITQKSVSCGGKSLTQDGTITAVESGSFRLKATDSRGNVTQKSVSMPFVGYAKLTCVVGNNMPDVSGNMTFTASGSCFNGTFGAQSNTLAVKYRYKTAGGNYGSWVPMTAARSGNAYTASANLTGLDYQQAYVFQVSAEDKLMRIVSAPKDVIGKPVFDWGATDFQHHTQVGMNGNRILGLGTPLEDTDAVNKSYADGKFAPKGYGLGASAAPICADCDTALNGGWHQIGASTVNGPISSPYGVMLVNPRYGGVNGHMSQVAFLSPTYRIYYRTKNSSGAWLAWKRIYPENTESTTYSGCYYRTVDGVAEWINPPMIPGEEYLTTERYKGKKVYTKLIECGNFPDTATSLTVTTNSIGELYCYEVNILSSTHKLPNGYTVSSGAVYALVNKSATLVTLKATGAGMGGYTAEVIIKYTKD